MVMLTQILHSKTTLYIFLILVCCQSIQKYKQINTNLPPLQQNPSKSQQDDNGTQITANISINEQYVHIVQYLQPQLNIYTKYCRYHTGQAYEDIIAVFPTSMHEILNNQDNRNGNDGNGNDYGNDYGQFVYVQRYGIVYQLWRNVIYAYRYQAKNKETNRKQLSYIEKIQLTTQKQNQQLCSTHLVLSQDQQYLYIFTCERIIGMNMKKSITSMQVLIKNQQNFYGAKAISGKGFIVWSSYTQGIRIYSIADNYNLSLIQNIDKINSENQENSVIQQQQKIVDISLSFSSSANILYLLGHRSTLFSLKQSGNGNFYQYYNLSLKTLCSENCHHRQLLIYHNNIYIYSVDDGQQFVSQFYITNSDKNTVEDIMFLRYYKSFKNYICMHIINQKLFIAYKHAIAVYQRNMHPKVIKRLINGITSSHFEQISHMSKMSGNSIFIKTTQTGSYIIKMGIVKPFVKCQFPKNDDKQEYIQQFMNVNVSRPCRSRNVQKQSSTSWKSSQIRSCMVNDHIKFVFKQEKKQYHTMAVIAVSVFCAAVIAVLMIWRKGKIQLIQNIVQQINKNIKKTKQYKLRNRGKVQFVQQIRDHGSSGAGRSSGIRQTDWNQLNQSYGIQVKQDEPNLYQIDDSPQVKQQIQKQKQQKQSYYKNKQNSKKQIQLQKIQNNNQKQGKQSKFDEQPRQLHEQVQQVRYEEEQDDNAQGTQRNLNR